MNRLREVKLYNYHQHSVLQKNVQIHIVTGCVSECTPWVWHSKATQSPWHKRENRMEVAFSYIFPVPGLSLFYSFGSLAAEIISFVQSLKLGVDRAESLCGSAAECHILERWGNWASTGERCPSQTHPGQVKSGTESDSDHTDCYVHSCSKKKTWSYFRVWIAPVSNSQAQRFVWLTRGGTVRNLLLLSS